jgi:hypothetical protein
MIEKNLELYDFDEQKEELKKRLDELQGKQCFLKIFGETVEYEELSIYLSEEEKKIFQISSITKRRIINNPLWIREAHIALNYGYKEHLSLLLGTEIKVLWIILKEY